MKKTKNVEVVEWNTVLITVKSRASKNQPVTYEYLYATRDHIIKLNKAFDLSDYVRPIPVEMLIEDLREFSYIEVEGTADYTYYVLKGDRVATAQEVRLIDKAWKEFDKREQLAAAQCTKMEQDQEAFEKAELARLKAKYPDAV